jgi:hypothetical protein
MMTLDPTTVLRAILRRTISRAKARNFAIDVDLEFLLSLWKAQQGCCAVSGYAFSDEFHKDAFVKTPFAPSLDRIDSSKGYVKENVRLVSMIANFAMGQWGHDVLRRFAHGVVETERKVHSAWFRKQRRKLRNAERAAESMNGEELVRQKRVIAGLKRAITMGPARLGGAALLAHGRLGKP